MHEIILFTAEGNARADNNLGFPTGERHSLLIFLRQAPGTQPDFASAQSEAERLGWSDIVIDKACSITEETLRTVEPTAVLSYEHALTNGCAMLAFAEPVS